MKKLAGTLMVLGVLVAGLGIAWPYQSSAQEDCERFRAKAVSLLDEAVAAKGTPRERELMVEAESESAFAEAACESAGIFRRTGYMILGGGLVLLVLGFAFSRKKTAA